jgi:hypothetical protein
MVIICKKGATCTLHEDNNFGSPTLFSMATTKELGIQFDRSRVRGIDSGACAVPDNMLCRCSLISSVSMCFDLV